MTHTEKMAGEMLAALRVIALDQQIRDWLRENDPKALEQVESAIRVAESYHVRSVVHGVFVNTPKLDEILAR